MDLIEFFRKVIERLKRGKVKFALTGGLLASSYRSTKRATDDIDFLILAESDTQRVAENIILEFGLVPHALRKSDMDGKPGFSKKTSPVYMVLGRDKNNQMPGLDFILPSVPWFFDSIERAQHNQLDFGIARVPCITVEDFIVSKIFSIYNDSSRFKDMDDLKSIFEAGHKMDLGYIAARMRKLKITFHPMLLEFVPKPLRLVSKKIKRLK